MAILPYSPRPLVWMGDSLGRISGFPISAKRTLGYGIRQVQNGRTPEMAKPLADFGSGIFELKADADRTTHRVVYAAKLKKAIYIIDAFVKKSKTGKKIPLEVRRRIVARIKDARRLDEE